MANRKKNDDKPSKIVKFAIPQNKFAPNALQPMQTAAPTAPMQPVIQLPAALSTTTTSTIKIIIKAEGSAPTVAAPTAKTFSNVAASGQKVGKGKGGGAKIFRNPRNLPRGSTGTHRPIGPRGSVVLLSDNLNLDRGKAEAGKVELKKMVVRFKDVKGNVHEHAFPGRADKKWDNDGWIASLNKWRYQTLSRKFKYDPTIKRGHRGKWTMQEKVFIQGEILKRVEKNGDRLVGEDWKAVAEGHNERFAGTVVKKGEQLLKGVAVKDYTITTRSQLAIRAAFDKMPDLVQMVDELIAQYTDDDGTDEEGEPMEGVIIEGKYGGELDHHLEDPSDDEDDGQRPASNQTGAILVEGAC